jgi:hypothetical protein
LERRAGAGEPGPLTVVLRDGEAGLPPGRTRRTNAAGLPVLEIIFDPAGVPPELPPPPFKLVRGADPVDLA